MASSSDFAGMFFNGFGSSREVARNAFEFRFFFCAAKRAEFLHNCLAAPRE